MANFVSYANATELMTAIGNKFKALSGVYIPRGNSAFASLPATLTSSMLGYVYNVTDDFTTDARFIDGAGKTYPAGTNIVVIDADTTGQSPVYKFDEFAGIVDLTALENAITAVKAMIAGDFDDTASYTTGDVVVYNNGLYRFTSDHAAGAWDANDVAATTVDQLITAAVFSAGEYANTIVSASKTTVEAMMAPAFAAANAYSIGDVVTYNDHVYKFKAAHTAGDPWSSSEVDQVTLASLLLSSEPDQLTAQQISDLEALL